MKATHRISRVILCSQALYTIMIMVMIMDLFSENGLKDRFDNAIEPIGWMLFLSLLVSGIVAEILHRRLFIAISEFQIIVQGVLSRREVDLTEVTELQWNTSNDTVLLIICTESGKVNVNLKHYADIDRLEFINFMHDKFPEKFHTNWPNFCHDYAMPLVRKVCRKRGNSPLTLREGEVLVTRRRITRLFIAGLGSVILVSVVLVYMALIPPMAAFVTIALVGSSWLALRLSLSKKGEVSKSLPAGPLVAAIFFTFFLFLLWCVLFRYKPPGTFSPLVIACAKGLAVLWLGALIWLAIDAVRRIRRDKKKREKNRESEVNASLQEWEEYRNLRGSTSTKSGA